MWISIIDGALVAKLLCSFIFGQTRPLPESGRGPVVDALFTLIVQDGAKVVSCTVFAVVSCAAFGSGESNSLRIPSLGSARLPATHVV